MRLAVLLPCSLNSCTCGMACRRSADDHTVLRLFIFVTLKIVAGSATSASCYQAEAPLYIYLLAALNHALIHLKVKQWLPRAHLSLCFLAGAPCSNGHWWPSPLCRGESQTSWCGSAHQAGFPDPQASSCSCIKGKALTMQSANE